MKPTGWLVGYILVLSLTACGEVNRGSSSTQELGSSTVGPSAVIAAPTPAATPPPSPSTPPSSSGTVATLQSLSISPSTIRQQGQPTGVVTFTTATESAANVVLETSNKGVAALPAAVIVEAGNSTAAFTIDTASVAADTTVTLTAKHGGISRTATLTILAGPPPENRPGPAPPSPKPPTQPPSRCAPYQCGVIGAAIGTIDGPIQRLAQ